MVEPTFKTNVSYSLTIMADARRERQVVGLVDTLAGSGLTGVRVVWDERFDRHETGLRALKAGFDGQPADPSNSQPPSHHVVLQDDAILTPNFPAQLSKVLTVADGRPVSLYLSSAYPRWPHLARDVKAAAKTSCSFVSMGGPWWGVGLVFPVADLGALTDHCAASLTVQYDLRIAEWYRARRVDWLYTLPSLVDHSHIGPSLIPGRGNSATRRAWRVAGGDETWSDRVWAFQGSQMVLEQLGRVEGVAPDG